MLKSGDTATERNQWCKTEWSYSQITFTKLSVSVSQLQTTFHGVTAPSLTTVLIMTV